MTRLLVVGGNGQVGRELRRSLARLGEGLDWRLVRPERARRPPLAG